MTNEETERLLLERELIRLKSSNTKLRKANVELTEKNSRQRTRLREVEGDAYETRKLLVNVNELIRLMVDDVRGERK